MAALSIEDVCHVYGDGTAALDGASLEVAAGEVVGIVGPSGCGKSTLLRIVAGIEEPSSGRIHASRGRIGVVFQQPTLLPWRSVRRNVALPLELRGTNDDASVESALHDVGLDDVPHKLPRQLSGGMQMRVAVARALVDRPELVLLDEPFASVDEMLRERMNDLFLGLRAARGFSAMFVTHSISEAVYVSDKVAVMSPRPGRFTGILEVPFGRTREPGLRYGPEFADLCGRVSALVRGSDR